MSDINNEFQYSFMSTMCFTTKSLKTIEVLSTKH